MSARYDALIVGARPAGAATAMLLARAGARVLVVERDRPGTDTLSTHALMRGAVIRLAQWGLLDRVRAAGTPPIRETRFVYGDEHVAIAIKPQHGTDALYAPRRTVLDPIIAAAAIEAGAEVRYQSRVEQLLSGHDGRVTGALVRGPEGTRAIEAGIVVGADGLRSGVARAVAAPFRHTGRHAAATIYGYVAGMADRGNRWHYGRAAAAGAIPTNDGRHVVFVAVPPDRFRAGLRAELAGGLMRVLAEVDPALATEAAGGRLVSPVRGFAGEAGFLRAAHGPGWALVGDAGCFRDPITAHGITDALRDAGLLAEALLAGSAAALARYEAARDALALPILRATDAIAGLDWSLDRLATLHRDLHAAMRSEQDHIAGAPVTRVAA